MPKQSLPDPPTTLLEARRLAVLKAYGDLIGASDPFGAETSPASKGRL